MTPRRARMLIAVLAAHATGCVAGTMGAHDRTPRAAELSRLSSVADRIIAAALQGNGALRALEELCDDIGHRLSGSAALDKAIAWAVATMKADGLDSVRTEPVMVPKWVRGRESLTMTAPRHRDLIMVGLGDSVGTPPGGLTAQVVVVRTEAELTRLGSSVAGKIVLFDNEMPPWDPVGGTHYGEGVKFRMMGPRLAAPLGAVAVLVRSVTARSLATPHTGVTSYGDARPRLPAAAITTEAADSIARLVARGVKVVVHLKMEARMKGDVPSANVIGELRGRERPDEIVVISGHLDSWDVGQGAHDDGAGCVIAMEALTTLRRLGLRPRRTIRVVLFTNEENGLRGARAYAEAHKAELARHVAAIESDSGGFRPLGYRFEHGDAASAAAGMLRLRWLSALLAPLGATRVKAGFSGSDIRPMRQSGVPLLGQWVDESRYFDYHHTPADTFDKIDPAELSQNVAAMAVMAWALAEMPGRLDDPPRAPDKAASGR